jgi:DNA (cytosine-5)-methyltransferase 1
MTHGSLFSGIGGFDLAAHWMGWDNIFHCEWNEFGQKVLKHHFPTSTSYNDITKTDFSIHRGEIDILTGGFPCQPYSSAGERLGKADERHLFPEMLRAIKEIKPRWIIGENVRGLVSWEGGLVFNEVCSDLEREGYEVQPVLIPAAAKNAPHKRERVWFIAYSKLHEDRYTNNGGSKQKEGDIWRGEKGNVPDSFYSDGIPSNTDGLGSSRRHSQNFRKVRQEEQFETQYCSKGWEGFPASPCVRGGDDGLSHELDSITIPKWCRESIKAYGNAIVPQVAFELFKTIELFENSL